MGESAVGSAGTVNNKIASEGVKKGVEMGEKGCTLVQGVDAYLRARAGRKACRETVWAEKTCGEKEGAQTRGRKSCRECERVAELGMVWEAEGYANGVHTRSQP